VDVLENNIFAGSERKESSGVQVRPTHYSNKKIIAPYFKKEASIYGLLTIVVRIIDIS